MPLTQITGEGVGTTSTTATLAVGNTTITGAATYTTSIKSTTALATPSALTATQATAFASTVSGSVIMGFGTTNDVSLMNRAGTVVLGIGPNTTAVNMTGLLTVSGFGMHSFSAGGTNANEINVRNTTAGAANMARISLGNDNASDFFQLRAMSSTFTPSADLTASGATVRSEGAGGLNLSATDAAGVIRFYSGGTTERARIASDGRVNIGSTGLGDNELLGLSASATAYNILTIKSTVAAAGGYFIDFRNASNSGSGSISHSGTTTVAYNTSSDQRLKTDLGLTTDVSVLRGLRIHDFAWTEDGARDRGVFAQEAYAITPRGITKGDDDPTTITKTWMVEKAAYVPDLIVGWQQHDATIATLTIQNTALEARIAILEARLAQ